MKILIIGNGYIGQKLFLALQNYDVTITGNKNNDYNSLDSTYVRSFSHVILLAGHSSVPSCNGPLLSSWNNNVRNFYSLLQKTTYKQHIIYASSSSVYGTSNGKLCTEQDASLAYMNHYDLTKTVLDQVALTAISKDRNIIGLRFGTVNGVSPIIRNDLLINSMVYSAITKNVINVSNSQINRPYLSINDLCDAITTILDNQWVSGIYNLATDNKTIFEYATIVAETTNTNIVDNGNTVGAYDFRITSDLFCNTFNFRFKDTVENIVQSLSVAYTNNIPVVARLQYYDYKG